MPLHVKHLGMKRLDIDSLLSLRFSPLHLHFLAALLLPMQPRTAI